ncbi:MAG TPA: hypothetical protein VMT47_08145, partial [Polyangia bacterium]|nr:hypothetical protein [Polyangia bacterium]
MPMGRLAAGAGLGSTRAPVLSTKCARCRRSTSTSASTPTPWPPGAAGIFGPARAPSDHVVSASYLFLIGPIGDADLERGPQVVGRRVLELERARAGRLEGVRAVEVELQVPQDAEVDLEVGHDEAPGPSPADEPICRSSSVTPGSSSSRSVGSKSGRTPR